MVNMLTTAQIRDQFAAYEDPTMRDGSTYEANVELFDRWLEAHDAEVRNRGNSEEYECRAAGDYLFMRVWVGSSSER